MDMRTPDRAFKHGPEGFKGVHMNVAPRPYLPPMLDCLVIVAQAGKDFVRGPFVGTDTRSWRHLFQDRRNEAFAGSIWDNPGEQFAAALKNTEHDGFALGSAPGEALLLTPALAADIGFVNLDVAGQRRIAVNGPHVVPNFMSHAERRGIRNPKLALQFLRGNTVARRAEQIHGVKPLLQRRMGTVKRRPDHRVNVMAAPLALISWLLTDTRKLALLPALRAIHRVAVAQFKQVVQTGIVVGKLLHKVDNGRVFGHFYLHLMERMYHICLHR